MRKSINLDGLSELYIQSTGQLLEVLDRCIYEALKTTMELPADRTSCSTEDHNIEDTKQGL